MPTARAPDGTAIAYIDRGAGPNALVLLHAWGASGAYFTETMAVLDPARRALAIDLRGHGDSDKPDTPLSWDLLARDVLAVADHASVDRFIAVGHSMGGKLAQYLTLVTNRIDALVLVNSPSAAKLPIPDFARAWVEHAGDGVAFGANIIAPFVRAPLAPATRRRIEADWTKIPRIYLERTLALVADTEFEPRFDGPVLVVSNDDDPIHVTDRDLVKAFPQAIVETLSCGLEIPIEMPQEFAALL